MRTHHPKKKMIDYSHKIMHWCVAPIDHGVAMMHRFKEAIDCCVTAIDHGTHTKDVLDVCAMIEALH